MIENNDIEAPMIGIDGMEHEFEYARQTLEIERHRLIPHERYLREQLTKRDNQKARQELSLARQKIANLDTAIWTLRPKIPERM